MQFEPVQIYTATSKILLLEAGVDTRRKDKLFRAIETQVQPGELKSVIADPDVARYCQLFSTGIKGICPQEEDLTIEVVSSLGWIKDTHLAAANGFCSARCLDNGRQSSYEKVSVMALTASIERPGEWSIREIIWFHPTPECKARFEIFDPTKTRKAYFHT